MWLVAEDSAKLEDRDLVRRQAGVLALHLQVHHLQMPLLRTDYEAAGSIPPRCVFITAGPFTKLCAWGRRRVEDMCYEIRRAEACVD